MTVSHTTAEYARWRGVTPDTVRRWIREGVLPDGHIARPRTRSVRPQYEILTPSDDHSVWTTVPDVNDPPLREVDAA